MVPVHTHFVYDNGPGLIAISQSLNATNSTPAAPNALLPMIMMPIADVSFYFLGIGDFKKQTGINSAAFVLAIMAASTLGITCYKLASDFEGFTEEVLDGERCSKVGLFGTGTNLFLVCFCISQASLHIGGVLTAVMNNLATPLVAISQFVFFGVTPSVTQTASLVVDTGAGYCFVCKARTALLRWRCWPS